MSVTSATMVPRHGGPWALADNDRGLRREKEHATPIGDREVGETTELNRMTSQLKERVQAMAVSCTEGPRCCRRVGPIEPSSSALGGPSTFGATRGGQLRDLACRVRVPVRRPGDLAGGAELLVIGAAKRDVHRSGASG